MLQTYRNMCTPTTTTRPENRANCLFYKLHREMERGSEVISAQEGDTGRHRPPGLSRARLGDAPCGFVRPLDGGGNMSQR